MPSIAALWQSKHLFLIEWHSLVVVFLNILVSFLKHTNICNFTILHSFSSCEISYSRAAQRWRLFSPTSTLWQPNTSRKSAKFVHFLATHHKTTVLTFYLRICFYDLLRKLFVELCVFRSCISGDFFTSQVIMFQAKHQKRILTHYQQRVRIIYVSSLHLAESELQYVFEVKHYWCFIITEWETRGSISKDEARNAADDKVSV